MRPAVCAADSVVPLSGIASQSSVLALPAMTTLRRTLALAPRCGWSTVGTPESSSSCCAPQVRAGGGEAALDAIERLRPDVVLLDLRMPDIDGIGVLDRLRDLDPPPRCKVLIVSASLDEHVEQAARAAGAAGCVSKDMARADICAAALRIARQ